MPDGNQLPLTHWENILGRAKGCDIVVDFPTVSRTHAVLTRYDDGSWSLTDIGSRGAVTLNGEPVQMAAVNYGDTISLGGVDMVLAPVTQSELEEQLASRTRPTHLGSPALTLFLLTVFQLLTTLQLWMGAEAETAQTIVLSFLGLLVMGWLLFAVLRMMRRSGYEVETLAFFLSTLGFAVIASDNPANLTKQLICLIGGIVIYLIIGCRCATCPARRSSAIWPPSAACSCCSSIWCSGRKITVHATGSRWAGSPSSRPSWSSSASSMSARLRWTAS